MKRTKREIDGSHRIVTRRALLLGSVQLAFAGALVMRMRHMQVEQADQFRLLAEENRINIRLIPPSRGEVYDRNGIVIAQNSPSYRIVIVREDAGDIDHSIESLSRLIELDDNELNRALAEMRRSAPFLPVTIADEVSWDDVSKVAVNAPALPGISPEVGLSRVYPRGSDFAHVVGYVGPVSDFDLERIEVPNQLLLIPRFQIGKVGLEAKKEEQLRGKAGAKRVEINATGRVMRELDRQEGQPGADMQLTIDHKLQAYLQARLLGESASAVIIDCDNGDLMAIGSAPTFDPNLFVRGISSADYSALLENKYRPLASKSVQGLYPPGSTFKMITAMAALEEGIISPEETVYCPGHMDVSGRRFHCWKRAGHGSMNLLNSLKQSCDVYYYSLALKVGIDNISAMANRFGLGVRHDLPMSAIAKGLTPTKAWKRATHDQSWRTGDTANSSIGQGFMLASPLQLAVMSARLATGRSVTPRLIRTIDSVEQPSGAGEHMGLNENNLRKMRNAMYAVSNDRRGTAYRSRIIADEFRMAGKTGTSQVRNITKAERRSGVIHNRDLPWERRDHALFVGFAPMDLPRYAVSVIVEHGGGGSKAAAPVARDLLLQVLYGGTPPLDAYPVSERAKIKEQQERLRDIHPQANIGGRDRA